MINAILFDFNGVIIDDEGLQMAAYQDILKEQGIELTETDYLSSMGMDDRTFVRAAYARANQELYPEKLASVLNEKTRRHRKLIENELPLFPGVVTFLKSASRHFDVGLVSMANREEIGYVLDEANLRSLFTVVVSAEDVEVCKPAPDCYESGFAKLNDSRRARRLLPVQAGECLVIEDSTQGIESGRAAGMRTLGVTNTVSETELRGAGAEVVTPSLFDWTIDAVRHVFGETPRTIRR